MQILARKWIVNEIKKDNDGDVVIKLLGFIWMTVYKLHKDNPSVMIHLFKESK